jgi:hypothetical protein
MIEPDAAESVASSEPPAARGVSLPASSLSENPVFKRARGEKVLVGAKVPPGADEDGPKNRPISQTELEQRFYSLADGADSVYEEEVQADTKKRHKKKDGSKRAQPKGLNKDQLDSLMHEAAFGGPSHAADNDDDDDGVADDAYSESACSSAMPGSNSQNSRLHRLNGVHCLPCILAASMNPVDDFLRENLGKVADETVYRDAAEVYERDVAGPARREGSETPRIPWKQMQLHYEQHSMDPLIQRHVELRVLQKSRTLLTLSACRDDGVGNADLDIAKNNQMLKILAMSKGLRQELEDLKKTKKK